MTESFESAFRQLITAVTQEVTAEILRDRQVPITPPALKPLSTDNYLLLYSHEAAKRLSVSESTLRRLVRSGELPCVRVGRTVRYSVESLQKWIRESETTLPPEPAQFRNSSSGPSEPRTIAQPTRRKRKRPKKATARERQNLKSNDSPASSTRTKIQSVEKERRRTAFDDVLDEIGVRRSDLPPITHGYLKETAEVDTATLHGWLYLGKQLPETALEKLRAHFRMCGENKNASDSDTGEAATNATKG